MITKGIIIQVLTNENKLKVRIPVFENTGFNDKVEIKSTICHTPGNLNSYNVGDVVFVGFENNSSSAPIVLGKLYLGIPQHSAGFNYINSLEVTGNVKLPIDTTIGEVKFKDILNLFKELDLYEDSINNLYKKIDNIVINTSLENLSDVAINNLEDNQLLKYNETTNMWENTSYVPFNLSPATEVVLGGIKASTKTNENVEIKIDAISNKLYAPTYPDISDMVTKSTDQEITGIKTFTKDINIGDNALAWTLDGINTDYFYIIANSGATYRLPKGVAGTKTIATTDNIPSGTVTQVNLGLEEYTPTNGVVSLPTYPTTLPASDVSDWAKKITLEFTDIPTGTTSTTIAVGDHTHSGVYEPIISSKGTAFNKSYGTTISDVKMNGTQTVGTKDETARIDHIHPIDTSRAADNAVVHKTGDEEIDGIKTFIKDVNVGDSALKWTVDGVNVDTFKIQSSTNTVYQLFKNHSAGSGPLTIATLSDIVGGMIVEDTLQDFPEEGAPNILYIAKDTSLIYYYDEEEYKLLVPTLNNISDINLNSPTNNQFLRYNSTSGKWENKTVNIPGGTVTGVTAITPLASSGGTTPAISFIEVGVNKILVGPSTGEEDGVPTFRKLVLADLPTGTDATTVAIGNHTHNNYVKTSDNQSIAGIKTFTNLIKSPKIEFDNGYIKEEEESELLEIFSTDIIKLNASEIELNAVVHTIGDIEVGSDSLKWTLDGINDSYFEIKASGGTAYQLPKGTSGITKQIATLTAGNTASRPILGIEDTGFIYFNTQTGKPNWWTGSDWVDAIGTSV